MINVCIMIIVHPFLMLLYTRDRAIITIDQLRAWIVREPFVCAPLPQESSTPTSLRGQYPSRVWHVHCPRKNGILLNYYFQHNIIKINEYIIQYRSRVVKKALDRD